jgi:glucose-6-phosphate 1-epimerase
VTTTSTDLLTAEAPGVRITTCAKGANLMTWTTDGVERLWVSSEAECGASGAIRGGVPVLFPQFGTFGPLVKHGFARTAPWQPVPPGDEPGRATMALALADSPATREVWPHAFAARLDVSASPSELVIVLSITNRDPDAVRFTGGLHTYFAVADPDAWVGGLSEGRAWDGADTADPAFSLPLGDRVRALEPQDLVISGVTGPVTLNDAELGRLTVTGEGFANRIVWNPGDTLADVPPGEESRFVCIEPTVVTPVELPAGATWTGVQRVVVG